MLYDPKWETPAEVEPREPWRKLLLRSADYIDRHGWCQHKIMDARGRVCLLGAMFEARKEITDDDAFYVAIRAVQDSRMGALMNAVEWNNEIGRTKEEVTAFLRGIARR